MLWSLLAVANADTITTGTLKQDTVIQAWVLEGELFRYYVRSTATCLDQDGNEFGQPIFYKNAVTAKRDTLVTCTLTGDEEAPVSEDEPWYFEVVDLDERGFPEIPGRVFSYEWIVTAEGDDFSHTFYAPAPVNSDPEDVLDAGQSSRLMKVQVAGLGGEDIHISANTVGLDGLYVQSGAPSTDPADRLPLFLSAADEARYATLPADVKDWSLSYRYTSDGCEGVIPGLAPATMSFGTSVSGLAGFGCDISRDSALDPSGKDEDVVGGFSTDNTGSTWEWYGENFDGTGTVSPGEYTCSGGVFVGAFHALIKNADVADPGVRLFAYNEDISVDGVTLYWNDLPLRDEVLLASGAEAPLQSGAGVHSGATDEAQEAPTNSHGWGNPEESLSRGSIGWIDTWTAGSFYQHGQETVIVLDADSDADSDGLPLATECELGTDPSDDDTDGDGVNDDQELDDGTDPTDASDYKRPEDTGTPDTDTGQDPGSVLDRALGNLSGGSVACAATATHRAASPLALGLLALALAVRRRR